MPPRAKAHPAASRCSLVQSVRLGSGLPYLLYCAHLLKNRSYRLIAHLREIERTQWLPTGELEDRQWRKFKALLGHAYDQVPYYRASFRRAGIRPDDIRTRADLPRIPILTKRDLQENFESLIADNMRAAPKDRFYTSGSTGTPTWFFRDKSRLHEINAEFLRFYMYAGYLLGNRLAKIWGRHHGWDSFSDVRRAIAMLLFDSTIEVDSIYLNTRRLRHAARILRMFRPQMMWGFTYSVYTLADYLQRNRIMLRPKGVICGSEKLYPDQRALMESAFGCKVLNLYAAHEVGPIACECAEQHGMHINMDGVLVEQQGTGREGQILVTNLRNNLMPLIRYNMEDIGSVLEGNCRCGRGLPLMQVTAGRISDSIWTPDGRQIFPEYFMRKLKNIPHLHRYQLVQEDLHHFLLRIDIRGRIDTTKISAIIDDITTFIGGRPVFRIEFMENIPTTPAGKFRYLISHVKK